MRIIPCSAAPKMGVIPLSSNMGDHKLGEAMGNDRDYNVPPSAATEAVLKASSVPHGMDSVSGIDFDRYQDGNMTVTDLVAGMARMGFQATNVAEAVRIINDMVSSDKTMDALP
jgi:hypothetical protein